MKIGLIRHFRVSKAFPDKFFVSHEEVSLWFEEYENYETDIPEKTADLLNWDICYSSPAPRAVRTAGFFHNAAPKVLPVLNELNILPMLDKTKKRPFLIWGLLIRKHSLSENEMTKEFQKKIETVIEQILNEGHKNILIVSHYFVMRYLQDELRRRGFSGRGSNAPRNGRLYIFEKHDS